ncbi:MAG: hypothetical protein NXI07_05280 [bacterium]|nr:hypothetical protein [bacterium]
MDELKRVEFGDAGAMPETLRSRVRRRRVVHRARVGGGVVCVLLVAVVGVLVGRPGDPSPQDSWRGGAVITIDDPMFDALDRGDGMGRVDTRWRAGARLDGDWVLEM